MHVPNKDEIIQKENIYHEYTKRVGEKAIYETVKTKIGEEPIYEKQLVKVGEEPVYESKETTKSRTITANVSQTGAKTLEDGYGEWRSEYTIVKGADPGIPEEGHIIDVEFSESIQLTGFYLKAITYLNKTKSIYVFSLKDYYFYYSSDKKTYSLASGLQTSDEDGYLETKRDVGGTTKYKYFRLVLKDTGITNITSGEAKYIFGLTSFVFYENEIIGYKDIYEEQDVLVGYQDIYEEEQVLVGYEPIYGTVREVIGYDEIVVGYTDATKRMALTKPLDANNNPIESQMTHHHTMDDKERHHERDYKANDPYPEISYHETKRTAAYAPTLCGERCPFLSNQKVTYYRWFWEDGSFGDWALQQPITIRHPITNELENTHPLAVRYRYYRDEYQWTSITEGYNSADGYTYKIKNNTPHIASNTTYDLDTARPEICSSIGWSRGYDFSIYVSKKIWDWIHGIHVTALEQFSICSGGPTKCSYKETVQLTPNGVINHISRIRYDVTLGTYYYYKWKDYNSDGIAENWWEYSYTHKHEEDTDGDGDIDNVYYHDHYNYIDEKSTIIHYASSYVRHIDFFVEEKVTSYTRCNRYLYYKDSDDPVDTHQQEFKMVGGTMKWVKEEV